MISHLPGAPYAKKFAPLSMDCSVTLASAPLIMTTFILLVTSITRGSTLAAAALVV